MLLEVNENTQFVLNGIVLDRVPAEVVETVHHYLFANYLISRFATEIERDRNDIIAEAEAFLAYEDAMNDIADIEAAFEDIKIGGTDD